MKELYDFRKITKVLEESQDIINTNDFGSHRNLQDVDHISGLSYLEQGLAEIYGDLAAHGKDEVEAKEIVDDVISELVDMKVLDEVPLETACDGAKAMWISNAKPRIAAHLKMIGVVM